MASLYGRFFEPSLFAVPYQEPEEHLIDMVRCCELLLCAYLAGREAAERVLPLAVPAGRTDGLFDGSAPLDTLREDALRDYDKARFHMDARAQATAKEGGFLALQYVRELWKLNELELFAFALALLPRYDIRFGQVFAFLEGSPKPCPPSLDLTLKLFHLAERAEQVPGYHAQRRSLRQKAEYAFWDWKGGLDGRACEFVLQNGETGLENVGTKVYLPGSLGELPLREELAGELAQAVSGAGAGQETLYLCLKGCQGSGRTTLARRAAERLDAPAVVFDCTVSGGLRREEFFDALDTACRECLLVQGIPVLKELDTLLEEPETARQVLETAGRFSSVVFVLMGEKTAAVELAEDRCWLEQAVPPLGRGESMELWRRELDNLPLSEAVEPWELANKFTFTPAQIAGAAQNAQGMALMGRKLNRAALNEAAYSQTAHKLGEHATLIYARHTWDQLVLGEEERQMLRRACDQVRYKHIVYDRWGFDQRLAYGKGVSMLFAGPPGTGKTMAAQVVANDLGIEMYKVDLSQVVSKYIGETEKNLNEVFNEAKKSNVILFFDETDAILGKRTEVKDSHDKNANLETAYLLQKMEEYDGITVMTTNYKENIDSAFFRRISYVIHFSFPDTGARKSIWKGIFPQKTPLDQGVDFEYLARQFELSGGSIKNIAVAAAFMAAAEGVPVSMGHIIRAVKYEMAKQGKIMRREDYGEYGFLLDGGKGYGLNGSGYAATGHGCH